MEEMHVLLKNRGKINPRSSQEYADRGGFEALKKALRFHIPELRKYYVKGTKNVGKCTKLGQILLKICSLFS